jgi:hypothetical protein
VCQAGICCLRWGSGLPSLLHGMLLPDQKGGKQFSAGRRHGLHLQGPPGGVHLLGARRGQLPRAQAVQRPGHCAAGRHW